MEAPLWERSKENAAPLERGRNVSVLEKSLVATDVEKNRRVREFEQTLLASEKSSTDGDELLIHWISYIKFSQEAFPSDTHAQFLLLERCFRALCPVRRYADDPRFVRVCCMYAEKTKRAREIFQYMYTQKIGIGVAVFWVAWAFVAEKEKDFAFAEKVYTKAIDKEAKPIKYVLQRHKQFQRRMSRHWLNASTHQDDDDTDEEGVERRGVLGGLSEDSVRRNERTQFSQPRSRTTRNPNPPTFSVRNGPSDLQQNKQRTSFAIFSDQNHADDGATLLDDSFACASRPERVLEREADRLKENTLRAERWNERGSLANSSAYQGTHQRTSSCPPAAFAVYVDEDCARKIKEEENEATKRHEAHRLARDDRSFRQREELGVAERLTADPLRYVRDPSQLDADQSKRTSGRPFAPTAGSKKKQQQDGYKVRLLQSDIGVEQNFEQARAAVGLFTLVEGSSNLNHLARKDTDMDSHMSMDASFDVVSMGEISSAQSLRHILPTPRNNSVASGTTIDAPDAVGTHKAEPTINTQLALKELSMMFSSPAFAIVEDRSIVDKSGGLGPILNESGVSVSADDNGAPSLLSHGVPNTSFAAVADTVGFEIHCDEDESDNRAGSPGNARPPAAFTIFTEADDDVEKDKPLEEKHVELTPDSLSGNAAPFLLFNEAMGLEVNPVQRGDVSPDSNGDTATFSLFNEAMGVCEEPVSTENNQKRYQSDMPAVSMCAKTPTPLSNTNNEGSSGESKSGKLSLNSKPKGALDYKSIHSRNLVDAVTWCKSQAHGSLTSTSRSLVKVLAVPLRVYDVQTSTLPRPLKNKTLCAGKEVSLGHCTGVVRRSLGSGAYGDVWLLQGEHENDIALKAQSPTGSLAHEYRILRKIHEKVKDHQKNAFPSPLAIVFLADGAMLGMTTISSSGTNLLDLANLYTTHGCALPERVVVHLTKCMLTHMEALHWEAKVVHCDVKPDNWVLRPCEIGGVTIPNADVSLVDFGRAVDLAELETDLSLSPTMQTKLTGKPCRDEMTCLSMRKGLPWSFDADTFGICASAHVLLFGRHLEIVRDEKTKMYMPSEEISGMAFSSLWTEFFESLLNFDDVTQQAVGSRPHSLRQLRKRMDTVLELHKDRLVIDLQNQAEMIAGR